MPLRGDITDTDVAVLFLNTGIHCYLRGKGIYLVTPEKVEAIQAKVKLV